MDNFLTGWEWVYWSLKVLGEICDHSHLVAALFADKECWAATLCEVDTGVITFLSSKAWTALAAGVSILLGMILAVVTL